MNAPAKVLPTRHMMDSDTKGFKKIEWIQTSRLSIVWAQSQRPLNDRHAQNIADNFDPEMFGLISVTKPNGEGYYHIIDGHHRKVAVERAFGEDQKVPCQVFDAEDPARAAALFDNINSRRKAIQPLERFKVRVAAGNDVEVAVNKIVKAAGYKIGANGAQTSSASNYISCVQALVSIHESHGPDVLKTTLDAIRATWSDDKSATAAVIVRGFADFVSEYRDVDWKRLREAVSAKYTPARLLGAAKMTHDIDGGNMTYAVKKVLVLTYNSGLRAAAKKLTSPEKN